MTALLAQPAAPIIDTGTGRETERRRDVVGARGGRGRARWEWAALASLLTLTAVLYLWDLSASGYANSFYAAAVRSGTQSWKAWFFGSLDSGNSITVDKPPASLWVMGLSARLFGFNSWSLLVPQALEGVASVALLYATVRRVAGSGAGLLAGAVLALTPAAVLMFRFDNPDALLTLLLTAGAYAMTRAIESASWRWLALAGSALGFAFLTKMLQGWLVLPAFALAYLIAAPTSLRRRLLHCVAGLAALLLSAGWWLVVVALWPAGSRPYIGGSTNNTVLDLVFGYNGFGRLFGGDGNGGGGGTSSNTNAGFGGATGLTRLFTSEMGNEISWLLPAALVATVVVAWLTRRAPRTDRTRAALVLWGGWLLVTGLTLSYMKGTVHPYYTVALAPAVAALVAIGAALVWRHRVTWAARFGAAAMLLAAGGWSVVLLARTSSWYPDLRIAVAVCTVIAIIGVLVGTGRWQRMQRATAAATVVTALVAALLGSAAFATATAAAPHTGSIPSVGPSTAQSAGGAGGMPGGSATVPSGTKPASMSGSQRVKNNASSGSRSEGVGGASPSGGTTGGTGGGTGGGGSTTSSALIAALKATTGTWAAAVVGSQSAAELELSSGKAVIAIGGWSGSDNSPTLAQFEAYVAAHRVRYYLSGSGQAGGGQSGVSTQIAKWVAANFTAKTIGGQTVYDLQSAKA